MKFCALLMLALVAYVPAYAEVASAEEEFQKLLAEESELAGQVAFDLRFGEVALSANEAGAAVFAFQRVLAQQPDNAEAHLGIARAYFDLGEDNSAKRHFDLLYGVADQTPQTYIQTYLAALEQRSGVRKPRTSAYAGLMLGYDDNITRIRDGQPPGSFGVFAIQSSLFTNAAAGIRHQQPINAIWHWQAGAALEYEKYHDFDDYDNQRLNADGGVGGRINAWRWDVSLLANEIRRDNQKLYQGVSVAAVGEHRVDGFWKKAGLRWLERDYGSTLANRDVDGYEVVLGARHAGNNIRWSDVGLDVFWGDESARADSSNAFGRSYLTAKLRWHLTLRPTIRLVAGYDYSKSEFKDNGAQTFILGVDREDDYRSALLRLTVANVWYEGLDLNVEISRDENSSNISTLTYDRDRVSLGLRYNWGV